MARPADLEAQVAALHSLRDQETASSRPVVVWEPFPPSCSLSSQEAHLRACKHADVFSPNHLELLQLFEDRSLRADADERSRIEAYANRLLSASLEDGGEGTVIVVRAGEHGCVVLSKTQDCTWFEPFFDPSSQRVVDATGAGNCFLGAFAVAFTRTRSLVEAAVNGTVAASFAVEQVGLPVLSVGEGLERWNDETFEGRLQEYRARMK